MKFRRIEWGELNDGRDYRVLNDNVEAQYQKDIHKVVDTEGYEAAQHIGHEQYKKDVTLELGSTEEHIVFGRHFDPIPKTGRPRAHTRAVAFTKEEVERAGGAKKLVEQLDAQDIWNNNDYWSHDLHTEHKPSIEYKTHNGQVVQTKAHDVTHMDETASRASNEIELGLPSSPVVQKAPSVVTPEFVKKPQQESIPAPSTDHRYNTFNDLSTEQLTSAHSAGHMNEETRTVVERILKERGVPLSTETVSVSSEQVVKGPVEAPAPPVAPKQVEIQPAASQTAAPKELPKPKVSSSPAVSARTSATSSSSSSTPEAPIEPELTMRPRVEAEVPTSVAPSTKMIPKEGMPLEWKVGLGVAAVVAGIAILYASSRRRDRDNFRTRAPRHLAAHRVLPETPQSKQDDSPYDPIRTHIRSHDAPTSKKTLNRMQQHKQHTGYAY